MDFYSVFNSVAVYPHHTKQNICGTRAKYRDGKKETAVKVYTINQESVYILISNVTVVGGSEELRALCDQFGIVHEFRALDDYPCEEYTETYLAKYDSFPCARTAKKYLDDKSFFGNNLHVFYAPEFETTIETSIKLQERRKYVAWKTKKGGINKVHQNKQSVHHSDNSKSTKPSVAERNLAAQPVTYVWAGREYTVYPNVPAVQEPVPNKIEKKRPSSNVFVPRQLQQKSSDGSTNSNYSYEIQGTCSTNSNLSHIDETSYLNTMSHVRTKISNVSVPNVRVSLKRKRRV